MSNYQALVLGASGSIGTAFVAKAAADGYTLLVGAGAPHTAVPVFSAKPPYDGVNEFTPILLIIDVPNVMVVAPHIKVNNVKEFIEYARANPSKINYGSGGVGSAGHLAMETFQVPTNTKMTHIPYKGSGPAITDLVSGEIQAMLMTIAAIKPYIDNNQVKAFATSGLVRSAALPDLPTLHESGLKGFNYSPWYGVFVPAKTPAPIMNQLHDAINKALENPENKKKLSGQGLETKVMTRQEFEKIYQEDLDRWYKTITKLNIKG
jgi:tripartite-type tricarboxylate transporter receptor subunit TctC